MRFHILAVCLIAAFCAPVTPAQESTPLAPFRADANTLLLYHFDEGKGKVAGDASGHGYDGAIRRADWVPGRFGKALRFNGKDSSVFRRMTGAITGLRQFTVECWFRQDNEAGRQFLMGKDVTFHFDLSDGIWTSVSLYNRGGAENNAEGIPHRQIGTMLGPHRSGRWSHLAACYDGQSVSFFLNGELKNRQTAPKDFSIGTDSRGFWVGCYIGTDYWFSGAIDEVRVSDCVRYDPEKKLSEGGRIYPAPDRKIASGTVRTPRKTGISRLRFTLKKLYGSNAAGRIYLKAPGKTAAMVGQYELKGLPDNARRSFRLDVSDEVAGPGIYILALEPTDSGAYIEVTGASIETKGRAAASWAGSARSRRTFQPPVLVPLSIGSRQAVPRPPVINLSPAAIDRAWGGVELEEGDATGAPLLAGNGYAEWWVDAPAASAYRVYLRYATGSRRPCDIVIDGKDLNDYTMCALNATGSSREEDAFWEYQGTALLKPGPHWIRVQDVLPDIYGIRLIPTASPPAEKAPMERYPQAASRIFSSAAPWQAKGLFGSSANARLVLSGKMLRLTADFRNTDRPVRLFRKASVSMEPFGMLRFRFTGSGSRHVLSLRLIDAKGDEKLLWRMRVGIPHPQDVRVPFTFEGNDVFDPAHVEAICFDLDASGPGKAFKGTITDPVLLRRDTVAHSEAEKAMLASAQSEMAETARRLTDRPAPLTAPNLTPWAKPLVPERHPLFDSTEPKPVTRATMGYEMHTTGARTIEREVLDQFHRYYNFGDVCWPHIGILPQRSRYKTDEEYRQALAGLEERLNDIKSRGLYLFDIWGYVPNNEAGPTPQVAPEHHRLLQSVFGDRFLGYDNGEQDGRYIGAYADRGAFTDRKGGWEDFVRWDEQICRDSMNFMNATGSLNFSHYYGERGARTLGLETAQGLPSDTLMFSFLRGASRQYGRLTAQATSIWSRFGYTMYHDRRTEGGNGYGLGPNKGCSLSLHRRLFFSGYTGGDSICGTEAAQFTGDRLPGGADELSPLGKQHLKIAEWARKHPDRGVMAAPVAFMLDFYNGWNMPRHLYRGDMYKIWGKLPYEKGDYLIDGIFRMIWPGYEDASYLRNERGFLCPTPYGDIFDVLNNRCHPDVLKQYAAIMLLGDIEMTPEAIRNLAEFVEAGGDLLIDARTAGAFSGSLTGVSVGDGMLRGRMSRLLSTSQNYTEHPYTYHRMTLTAAQPLLVSENGDPLLTVNRAGKGRVIVCAADHWVTDKLTYATPEIVGMEPPYRLLRGIRAVLNGYFGTFSPATVSPQGLTVRTNLYESDPKKMLIGLFNNDLFADWKGILKVRQAQIASARDLWRNRNLAVSDGISLGVPAGDVAMVEVRLK